MTIETIRSLLDTQPFRPLTIHTTSRASYHVDRREAIWQAPEGGTIVISTGGESWVMVAMNHITSIEVGPPQAGES